MTDQNNPISYAGGNLPKKPLLRRIRPIWPLVVPVLGAGAASVFVVGAATTPCLGATRSAALDWQRRSAEIDRQVAGAGQASTDQAAADAARDAGAGRD